ncbi:hypothetical protein A2333_02205 [Candidatus Wolfebacteria bacterium RIFOXYB2_FULL_49_7]|uniref:Uncharacterized protein n=1 Tax=Candidatus Wolfebacteria bacterium RIFOXYB1_FULL_54_12 TaxID=1802559 RepID=A0A1F8DXX6_9BACT|nr:MAG: hypothetical protein A2372_03005 [Candidatus Wolfebacteria bacterium RIFOXYB1_FULL_54_12]OGM96639.1 MAG: hypothetical protein A2333_02205 [Candidatus Wolfebacteria bacterium RIFOXYB2_FULL_49_7]
MDIFLIYLFDRFIYRMANFLRHWYVDSFTSYSRFIIARLEHMDRTIALKVTWRNLFQPLYQERNIFGYVLGFLFRSTRLIGGGITYAIVIVSASVIYLAWAGVLPYILLRIAGHTPAALFYMKNS